MIWAPEDSDSMNRIIGGFRQFLVAAEAPNQFLLHVIIRHEPLPCLSDPALVLDLWQHPLLTPKNRDVVRAVTIWQQPVFCVLPHRSGPIRQAQTLAIITLGAGSTTAMPKITAGGRHGC